VLCGLLAGGLPALVRAQVPADCPGLGAALVDHSCFHAKYGPFATRLATPGPKATEVTPDLDPVHSEYRVGLAGSESAVTYEPNRSGDFSVFLGTDVTLTVRSSSGNVVPESVTFVGRTGCDALPISHVFELERSQRYILSFGPTSSEEVVVVIEYVDDFAIKNGRDEDGDGYGNATNTILSTCTPPPGYVQNVSDCDDLDPSIHPGAVERCGDDTDQNCNGLNDDVGLSCSAGAGACRSEGEWSCAGSVAACTASAKAGQTETCNGVDDDCNDAIDDGPNLCPSADLPMCVRDGFTAFCGCLLDLDCGPRDSGRVCDKQKLLCVDGCSAVAGENGCSDGQHCEQGRCARDEEGPGAAGAAGVETLPMAGGPAEQPSSAGASDTSLTSASASEGCGCRIAGNGERAPNGMWGGSILLLGLVLARRGARAGWLGLIAFLVACAGRVEQRSEHEASAGQGGDPYPAGGSVNQAGQTVAMAGALGSSVAGQSGCQPTLGSEPVEHACSHVTLGPYVDVAALAGQTMAASVSQIQTAFKIDVVGEEGELAYTPARDGDHVLFTDKSVVLRVYDAAGAEFALREVAAMGCRTITEARVVELEQDHPYVVRIALSDVRHFTLFIEHLGTFGEEAWSQRCDD